MTGLLSTFFTTAAEPNLRGELDGAAWRFILPGDAATIQWRTRTDWDERDIRALRRRAEVIRMTDDLSRASGSPVFDVIVGPARTSDRNEAGLRSSVGIEFSPSHTGLALEFRFVDDELRGVAPVADAHALSLLRQVIGADGRVRRTWKQMLRGRPARTRRTVVGSMRGVLSGPPRWLIEAASQAGLDVSSFEWALWCRGDFASQKLVLFLLPPGKPEPEVVVKITRDTRFNDRLINESKMLRSLASLDVRARGGAPELLFETTTWGSAASAQSAVVGSDLGRQLAARPELIERVTGWMVELANATRSPTDGGELNRCISDMLDMYVELYPVASATEQFLRKQAEILVDGCPDAVMQHGDPGTWNAVVDQSGSVAFLDWEAGELRGLPLWDLFYFLRAASLHLGPARPWQRRRTLIRRHFISGSDVGDLVAEQVRTYVERTNLDPTLAAPLFHLCWVHRAVKEARRLGADRSNGNFHRMILDSVSGHDEQGLRLITLCDRPIGSTT